MNINKAGFSQPSKAKLCGSAFSGTNSDIASCERQKKRSEEHTSELQSQSNLVCRLLLEKKKNIQSRIFSLLLLHVLEPIAAIYTLHPLCYYRVESFIYITLLLSRNVDDLHQLHSVFDVF